MEPTPEQSTIIAAMGSSHSNLIVNAYAGTGKTATLEMIERHAKEKPVLFLAFNKKIADEATKRMSSTTTVRTFNGLGHRIWASQTGRNLTLNTRKSADILREIINEVRRREQGAMWDSYWAVINGVATAKSVGYVPEGKYPQARRLCSQAAFHAALDESPDDLTADLIDAVLHRSIQAAFQGKIDYNDQPYMPAVFGAAASFPRYPLVLVDEAQDLNPINHALLDQLAQQRVVFVGDRYQCHHPETEIFITGRGWTPIQQVAAGMEAGYYSTRQSRFIGFGEQGREIEKIHTSQFKGNLVVVDVNGKQMKITPNHKCIARVSRDADGHILYLMRKGNRFRLGISRVRNAYAVNGSAFGPAHRARQEKADAVWLLEHYINEIQAHAFEQYYAAEFGIPTALFVNEKRQDELDIFWNLVDDNTDRALDILSAFNRDVNYPFWTTWNESFVGFHRAGVVHATNLISGIMTMLTHPDGNWHPIEISREAYDGPVFGITVVERTESRRVYLANGILVHNSIYGFRGAVQGGMAALAGKFSATPLDLSVSFRCPQAIVEAARWRVPGFQWIKEGGHVQSLDGLFAANIDNGSVFLCRNNAPLFGLALRLLSIGRSVSIAGSDIGPKLVSLMKKLGPESLTQAQTLSAIESWRAERLDRGSTSADDLADCMKVFAEHGSTLGTAIAYAEHVLAQTGTIRLMTIHKSKGLEFDTVYHLDPWLCREDEQDLNLRYVAITRSKDRYFEINSKSILWQ